MKSLLIAIFLLGATNTSFAQSAPQDSFCASYSMRESDSKEEAATLVNACLFGLNIGKSFKSLNPPIQLLDQCDALYCAAGHFCNHNESIVQNRLAACKTGVAKGLQGI